jgi:prepilin-type processing-associated H-X9-DG protein
LRGSEKLNDLLGQDSTDAKDGADLNRLNDGVCGSAVWPGSTLTGGVGTSFAGTATDTPERAALVARYFMLQGYATNYAACWHLARTTPRLTFDASFAPLTGGVASGQGLKGVNSTVGPLTRRIVEGSPIHSSQIALLGDAAPGDIDEATASMDIGYSPTDPFANGKTESETLISGGELLCEAMNDGPAFFNAAGPAVTLIAAQGAALATQVTAETAKNIPAPTGPAGNNAYLQDTRDWFAVHGGGSCNVLMADSSVLTFNDLNGDKFINPGFPVPAGLSRGRNSGSFPRGMRRSCRAAHQSASGITDA